ncbi:hypothetical protein N4G69_21775 [Streptomyces mirabilis]|uniref:hypothetical protein n=1 Tax=Streptomyces mirabilis TaxID=68239 RepID=UPI0021C19D44|nr:hypothetical protein [Streptomyces mirabilis]MCT9108230.1 hypothetical protein [Streptomyces mirabilis]
MGKTPERIWEEADLAARRLAGLALNPATPQDVLLRLFAEGPAAVRMVLCRDRVLPDAVVDAVIEHPDTYTRSFFARNPHVDPAQRVRLIDDPEWFVRAHLADGPRMPFQVRPEPLPDEALVHMIRTYGNDELAGLFYQQISTELLRTMHTPGREGPPLGGRRVGVAVRRRAGRAAGGPRRGRPGRGAAAYAQRGCGLVGERDARQALSRTHRHVVQPAPHQSRRGPCPDRSGQ